ncbi:hypothetical protein [Saccharococcus caldoxylosilyticus]|uniref:Uncharacterized protein n=1 Tax=Saccharococcus caldoxylosilyticus TaxID=81408 RepID=A0A150L5A2_9BACL|nr:hypothetical protein [Parageobacillus caldoxylosilyticus]KYD07474.1 hypothetical protein B4119_1364 [Parageobacillus caldoxylosilyticus]
MLTSSVSVTLNYQRCFYKEKSFLFDNIDMFTAIYTKEIASEAFMLWP